MVSRKTFGGAALAATAFGLALAATSPARAATDLQAFRATLSPGGSVVDLTESGPLDWVHWGYQMTGGPFDQNASAKSVRKGGNGGGGVIGALQILPPMTATPPELYWFPKQSTTVSFRWTDGVPVADPGVGVSVRDGVSGVPGTRFIFRAASGTELRQLSIYLAFACTDLVQVDITLGTRSRRLTSTEICAERFENHKITIRYSSDDGTDVVVTSRGGIFGEVGATLYAATVSVVDPGGGQPPGDAGVGDAGSRDASPDPQDASGGSGGAGGAGGATSTGGSGGGGAAGGAGPDAGTGAPDSRPGGRVFACAVGGGLSPTSGGMAVAGALVMVSVLVRRRPQRRRRR